MCKRIISSLVLICICACIGGCKTSFVEDSKNKEIDINEYFNELEPSVPVNSATSINDLYFTNGNGSESQEKAEEYTLYEDTNCLYVSTSFSIDYSTLGWEENGIVRIYLITNGILVPFSVDETGEYQLYNDLDYTINEELEMPIRFRTEDIPAENGNLIVLAYFYPEAEAGRGLQSYGGGIARKVKYVNQYCDNIRADKYAEYTGEYIDIPITSASSSLTVAIGDENFYDSEYVIKRYEGDVVVVDSREKLYIYLNDRDSLGESENLLVGILVDGKLCKISEDNYFIKIQQNSGRMAFKYSLADVEELGSGLHSISILKQHEDGHMKVSKRYAVIIK